MINCSSTVFSLVFLTNQTLGSISIWNSTRHHKQCSIGFKRSAENKNMFYEYIFLALKQLYLYFKTIKFLASDLKTNQETSISPSCKLSKLIAPPVTFTLMPNILHFPSEAGIYLVHSLKPLYFVDISKRDIIYIHFNVRKKLSIFQRAEKIKLQFI